MTVACETIPVLGDVEFSWQSAPQLTNWLPVVPFAARTNATGDPFRRRIEADFLTLPEAADFFRLQVTRKPAGP